MALNVNEDLMAPTRVNVRVHWPKTLLAWLATSALLPLFVFLVSPAPTNYGDARTIILMGVIWMAMSAVMVVTQISLHGARSTSLRHYVAAYPIVVSPILLDSFVDGLAPGWMLMFSFLVWPVVAVFWGLYARGLRALPKECLDASIETHSRSLTVFSMRATALALCLTFVGIFVLNRVVTLVAAPLLDGEEGHPMLIWHGLMAAFVVACWGSVVHFAVLRNGHPSTRNYILGFLVFVFGYSLFDLAVVFAFAVLNMYQAIVVGWESLDWSFSPADYLDRVPRYARYSLFPATVLAGGPLLWWIYHRALPRIWPESLPGE